MRALAGILSAGGDVGETRRGSVCVRVERKNQWPRGLVANVGEEALIRRHCWSDAGAVDAGVLLANRCLLPSHISSLESRARRLATSPRYGDQAVAT